MRTKAPSSRNRFILIISLLAVVAVTLGFLIQSGMWSRFIASFQEPQTAEEMMADYLQNPQKYPWSADFTLAMKNINYQAEGDFRYLQDLQNGGKEIRKDAVEALMAPGISIPFPVILDHLAMGNWRLLHEPNDLISGEILIERFSDLDVGQKKTCALVLDRYLRADRALGHNLMALIGHILESEPDIAAELNSGVLHVASNICIQAGGNPQPRYVLPPVSWPLAIPTSGQREVQTQRSALLVNSLRRTGVSDAIARLALACLVEDGLAEGAFSGIPTIEMHTEKLAVPFQMGLLLRLEQLPDLVDIARITLPSGSNYPSTPLEGLLRIYRQGNIFTPVDLQKNVVPNKEVLDQIVFALNTLAYGRDLLALGVIPNLENWEDYSILEQGPQRVSFRSELWKKCMQGTWLSQKLPFHTNYHFAQLEVAPMDDIAAAVFRDFGTKTGERMTRFMHFRMVLDAIEVTWPKPETVDEKARHGVMDLMVNTFGRMTFLSDPIYGPWDQALLHHCLATFADEINQDWDSWILTKWAALGSPNSEPWKIPGGHLGSEFNSTSELPPIVREIFLTQLANQTDFPMPAFKDDRSSMSNLAGFRKELAEALGPKQVHNLYKAQARCWQTCLRMNPAPQVMKKLLQQMVDDLPKELSYSSGQERHRAHLTHWQDPAWVKGTPPQQLNLLAGRVLMTIRDPTIREKALERADQAFGVLDQWAKRHFPTEDDQWVHEITRWDPEQRDRFPK